MSLIEQVAQRLHMVMDEMSQLELVTTVNELQLVMDRLVWVRQQSVSPLGVPEVAGAIEQLQHAISLIWTAQDELEKYLVTVGVAAEPADSDRGPRRAEQVRLRENPQRPKVVVGDPDVSERFWREQERNTLAALACQEAVLAELTGQELTAEAREKLLKALDEKLDPYTGTTPEKLGALLEAGGVPMERARGGDERELREALARGEKVIVGVDARSIHRTGGDGGEQLTSYPDQPVGHSVVVIGIENPGTPQCEVILNDPSPLGGRGVKVSWERFAQAWRPYGNLMVATRVHG